MSDAQKFHKKRKRITSVIISSVVRIDVSVAIEFSISVVLL
jgi:hypothetical protein